MSTPGSEPSPHHNKGSPAHRVDVKPRVSSSDLAAEAEAKRRKVLRACDVCRR